MPAEGPAARRLLLGLFAVSQVDNDVGYFDYQHGQTIVYTGGRGGGGGAVAVTSRR